MPPIRQGDGTGISDVRLGDGTQIGEVRKGDGTVLWSSGPDIPDSGLLHEWDVRELTLSDQDSVSTFTDSEGSADLSGTGNPIYETNIFDGEPGILLDGVDDYFGTSLPSTIPQPAVSFAVVSLTDDGSRNVIYSLNGDLSYISHRFDVNAQQYDMRDLNGDNSGFGNATAGGSLMTTVFDGASGSIRRNGSQETTIDSGDGDITDFYSGVRNGQFDRHLNGHVAYYSIYDYDRMYSGQIADIESTLNNIFGVF